MLTPDKYDLSGLTIDNIGDYGVCLAATFAGGTGTCYASYNGIQSMRYARNAHSMDHFMAVYRTECAHKAIESLKYKVNRIYEIAKQIKCWPEVMNQISRLSNKGDVSKIQWYAAFDGTNYYLFGEVTRQLQYGQSKVGLEVFIKANNKVLIKMCQRQATIKNID